MQRGLDKQGCVVLRGVIYRLPERTAPSDNTKVNYHSNPVFSIWPTRVCSFQRVNSVPAYTVFTLALLTVPGQPRFTRTEPSAVLARVYTRVSASEPV